MNKKEFLKEKLMQLMFGWECHPHWYKFAHIIELFLYSSLVSTGQFNVQWSLVVLVPRVLVSTVRTVPRLMVPLYWSLCTGQ